jgi:hypothetical protein
MLGELMGRLIAYLIATLIGWVLPDFLFWKRLRTGVFRSSSRSPYCCC